MSRYEDDPIRTTVYRVDFEKERTCLNVGPCCVQKSLRLPGAHYEAKVRRMDDEWICESCDQIIPAIPDSEFEE